VLRQLRSCLVALASSRSRREARAVCRQRQIAAMARWLPAGHPGAAHAVLRHFITPRLLRGAAYAINTVRHRLPTE